MASEDFGVGTKPEDDIVMAGGELEFCESQVAGDVTAYVFTGVGYTAKDAGGVLSDKQPTYKDVKVTGMADPVKRRAVDREVTFKATLLQVTLENFRLATGSKAADVVGGVFLGGKAQEAEKQCWRYTVKNEDDAAKSLQIYIPRGQVIEAVEVPFADEKETGVQVTIKGFEVKVAQLLGAQSLVGYRYAIKQGAIA